MFVTEADETESRLAMSFVETTPDPETPQMAFK